MFNKAKCYILLIVAFLVGCKSTLTLNEAPVPSYNNSARVYLAPLVLGGKGVKLYYPDDLTSSYGPNVLSTDKLSQLSTFCQKSYDQDNNAQAYYGDNYSAWFHNEIRKELERHNVNLVNSPQKADLIVCPTFLSLLYYGEELGPSIIIRTYASPKVRGSFSSLVVDVSQKGIYFPLYEGEDTIKGRKNLLNVIVQQLIEKSVEKRIFDKPENLNDLPKEKYSLGQLVQVRELNYESLNTLEKRVVHQEKYIEPHLNYQAFRSSAPAFYNKGGLIQLSSLSEEMLELQGDLNDDYFSSEGNAKYRLNIEVIRPKNSLLYEHNKETELFYSRERFDLRLTIEQLYPQHSIVYQSTDQIFSDNYCYTLCRNAHEYKDELILLRLSEFKGKDVDKELSEVYANMNDFAQPPSELAQLFHSTVKGTFSAVKKLEPVVTGFWNGAKAVGSGVKSVGSGLLNAATSNEMVGLVSGVSSSASGGKSSQEIMKANYQQQRNIVQGAHSSKVSSRSENNNRSSEVSSPVDDNSDEKLIQSNVNGMTKVSSAALSTSSVKNSDTLPSSQAGPCETDSFSVTFEHDTREASIGRAEINTNSYLGNRASKACIDKGFKVLGSYRESINCDETSSSPRKDLSGNVVGKWFEYSCKAEAVITCSCVPERQAESTER